MIMENKTNRKAIKNPFAQIHKASVDNGGTLPEGVRKQMMQDAIKELYRAVPEAYTAEKC